MYSSENLICNASYKNHINQVKASAVDLLPSYFINNTTLVTVQNKKIKTEEMKMEKQVILISLIVVQGIS